MDGQQAVIGLVIDRKVTLTITICTDSYLCPLIEVADLINRMQIRITVQSAP